MTDTKITSRQAIMMVLTVFVAHTIVSLPQNLIKNTKSATIINLVYVGILAILLAYIIYRLLKNFASLDIIDISEYLGGTVFKNIVGSFFIVYFMVSSASLLREFCEGLRIAFFPMTNILFIIFPFILGMFINNNLSFGSNAKTISIVFPIVLASIIFLFFANYENFAFERMFPILGKGFVNTFITGIGNITAFGGISCLYFLPPYLKEPQKMKKICLTSVIIWLIYFIFCVSTILFMFSFFIEADKVLPLYSAARYIEFGTFFQRLEAIFMLIWILEVSCYVIVANRFSMSIFQKMANLQEQRPLALIFPIIIFGISLIPKNYAVIRFFEAKVYSYMILGIVFVLGIGILILANLKKKKAGDIHEKSY